MIVTKLAILKKNIKKWIRFTYIKMAFLNLKQCCMTVMATEVFFNLEGKIWKLFI